MCGCGQTCRRSLFLRFDLACVYAGPRATTCVLFASFHIQTHIDLSMSDIAICNNYVPDWKYLGLNY
jgi:hypothetical protein